MLVRFLLTLKIYLIKKIRIKVNITYGRQSHQSRSEDLFYNLGDTVTVHFIDTVQHLLWSPDPAQHQLGFTHAVHSATGTIQTDYEITLSWFLAFSISVSVSAVDDH